MNILLTGATGFIGRHIQQALQDQGHNVRACSRENGVDFAQMLAPEKWLEHLQGIDAVINAVGIIVETKNQKFEHIHQAAPTALFTACEQLGIKRVIQISALGVEGAFTDYQRTKKAADGALQAMNLDWFVLRPSLVYGDGGDSTEFFKRLASLPVISVPGDGRYLLRPVHVSDVVAAVLTALNPDTPAQQLLDVVGHDEISYRDWLQALRKQKGKSAALIIPIPMPLIMATAHVGKYIVPILHPDNMNMLTRGNTAPVEPFQEFLGRMPLDIPSELAKCHI